MKTRNLRPGLLLAALPVLLLQACGGILTSEQPAKQYYLLVPYETSPAAAEPVAQIGVSVTAVPGLDTDHIQALGADSRLNRYSNARWPDHLPEVLTSVLRRSLESSGNLDTLFSAVTTAGAWNLQLEVRQFYGRQDAAGDTESVIVELAGTLVCADLRQPVHLQASSRVGEQRLSVVVAAHQSGLDSVTRDLLELLKQSCGT
jgi:ABC-type uncharacterized transport system auxiliary subunit